MIASNDHGRLSLAPRNTCGQLLILPQVYLDMMFDELPAEAPAAAPATELCREDCLTA